MPAALPNDPCSVDAAIIKAEPGLRWEFDNGIDGRPPTALRDLFYPAPADLVAVKKFGAASGLTRGYLDPVAADHHVWDVPVRYTCGWFCYGEDCQFARQGDSGAVVLDENHEVIGMAVAIEAPQIEDDPSVGCFMHGIRQIFSALAVALID